MGPVVYAGGRLERFLCPKGWKGGIMKIILAILALFLLVTPAVAEDERDINYRFTTEKMEATPPTIMIIPGAISSPSLHFSF